ncbi:MAG: acyl-CoA dehydrogenase [Deltaproteobacteria bacterium]|nr:acyl-CoA dehydrogenase [Deltaproteobacteria bacterium]
MSGLDGETLELVISSLKKYSQKKLTPEYLLSLDKADIFPKDVLKDLYNPNEIGLHLLFVPEEFGGFGAGAYDIYRVSETLASIDLGVATAVLATFLGTDPISVGGTEAQKNHWMKRIAGEGLLVAYGATEPQAGSDLTTLKTVAKPVEKSDDVTGDIKGYILNGQKQWISNGGVAQVYTILADTPKGPSWFIVERDTKGFSHGKPEEKHGIRASNTAALFLDDVFVPADRLIGKEEGKGLSQAQAVFGYTRLMVAAFGLGAGWAALKRAIRYSQERYQGGSLLCEKQAFTHKLLVPNAVRLETARSFIEWTAEKIDQGGRDMAVEGAIAKYLATEGGNKAAEDAIQAHGGYGYTREYMVEKIKRDVRITTIYEGTSEVLENTIARSRWQLHLKTRGEHFKTWSNRLMNDSSLETSGGRQAGLAMLWLAEILERCRESRLTRSQHVMYRLGELITVAEGAAIFAGQVKHSPSKAVPFGQDCMDAMSRICAREAAQKIAWHGSKLIAAANGTPPNIDFSAAIESQTGMIQDMDLVAKSLIEAYPAGTE